MTRLFVVALSPAKPARDDRPLLIANEGKRRALDPTRPTIPHMEYLGRRTTSMAKEGCFEPSEKGSLQCKRNSAVSKGKNVVTNSLRWQEYKSATERDGAPRVDVRSPTTFHPPPWMPRNILKKWPTWLSRWFGYRPPDAAPPATTNYVVWIWSFIGAFGGLSVLQAIFTYSEYFLQRKVPSIIASYLSISRHLVSSLIRLPSTVWRVLPPCLFTEQSSHR